MAHTATNWWLRSPNTNNTNNAWNVNSNGDYNNNCSNSNGVRPALMEKTRESSLSAKTASPSSKGVISCRRYVHNATINTLRRCHLPCGVGGYHGVEREKG